MIKPILACNNPYATAKLFQSAGWNIDFSQPPESPDPLVSVSLCGNFLLLCITEGYVPKEHLPYIGCGVDFYITVPPEKIDAIYKNHKPFHPSKPEIMPWGDYAFEVSIDHFKFMIASGV